MISLFFVVQVSGYCGLLLGSPVILYEIIAFVLPGLTRAERRFLGPIVFGSSLLFYAGLAFSYWVLTPAALNFFVNYAEGVVESLWSIDQYFEFVLVLMFSTGLSFQVCGNNENLHVFKHCVSHLHIEFWLLVGFAGSSYSVTPGTSRGGFGGSNAVNMEICGGGCGRCSSCTHALDRPRHSNAPSNAASGTLLGWCMDGQAHRSVRSLVVQKTNKSCIFVE